MIDKKLFGELPYKISDRISVLAVRHHSKAGEAYLDVEFSFPTQPAWIGSVPVNYRATGLDAQTIQDCENILQSCLAAWDVIARQVWEKEASTYWQGRNAATTRPFFEALFKKLGQWVCQNHELPPNPNWARRTQDIKGCGFTLSTKPNLYCGICKGNKTHIMLLPVPLGAGFKYETMSKTLIKRIVKVLDAVDAFEGRVVSTAGLLPDHKFPEVRWASETGVENPESMSEVEIRAKFQLLNNQRNQQKREVCRSCYQTGRRGFPYGIKFFAEGDADWPKSVPEKGYGAEQGCVGCAWYDFAAWRSALLLKLNVERLHTASEA